MPRMAPITGGYQLIWENPQTLRQNQEVSLRFHLLTPNGKPALLQPYMGMLGHAVVRHNDGTVFAHIHPAGTFSMAAQEFFLNGKAAAKTNALVLAPESHQSHTNGIAEAVSFPYAFPEAGLYRLWVQTKSEGKILTAVFDADISAAVH